MREGDFTFEPVMEIWLVAVDLQGGMPEAEATSRGQHILMRMMGSQSFLGGCCTQCMLYSVHALLGVNS